MQERRSVLVAGAGPVGVITALGFGQRGMAVTVLETERDMIDLPGSMV